MKITLKNTIKPIETPICQERTRITKRKTLNQMEYECKKYYPPRSLKHNQMIKTPKFPKKKRIKGIMNNS